MKLFKLFLPHRDTHQKAHLISIPALFAYVAIFIILQMSLGLFNTFNPGVLGLNSEVNQQELIRLTNIQREKNGLPVLSEDERLNKAALEKAKNMFEEDYWAHYSPSGKDPWGFIQGAGYKFSYAGENLARNFYTSQEVIDAWMASPTHKSNIINNHYQNIGIAVLEGTLKGQKTILIVQEFGTPYEAVAFVPNEVPKVGLESASTTNTLAQNNSAGINGVATNSSPSIINNFKDPFMIIKSLGFGIMAIIGILLIIDFIVLKKRSVVHTGARQIPHIGFLAASAAILANFTSGQIL